MTRTVTSDAKSFARPKQATIAFENSHAVITITVPVGSDWTSGLHWHETHTEFLEVIQGQASITIAGRAQVLSAGSPPVRIEPYEQHEWWKATDVELVGGRQGLDEDLVVKEWTTPMDGQKEVFFRNLASVLLEPNLDGTFGKPWLMLQLLVIFHGHDNYPVFVDGFAAYWITHVVLALAALLGLLLGFKPIYEEYTPKPLADRYHGKTRTE
ncbi:MAG: hypothetical protein M1838_005104 [Thelocarpon superellum]|nr:MAG: hypothetical protein M1838_005104 [Thelocarpon superellum]